MRTSLVAAIVLVLPAAASLGWSTGCGGSTTTNDVASPGDAGHGGGSVSDAPTATTHHDSGAPTGVGANGGTVSSLRFTVIGDTRPASVDDLAGYPTAVIDALYQDIAKLQPAALFSVSTGDYQFSTPYGNEASSQLNLYLAARAKFPGPFFPAMGNHECTGGTASNCGPGNTNGMTDNYNQFMAMMLGPIQKTKPYYSINIDASDGSWTSKFVFVAANAWDSGQDSWLQQTMAQKTTYTFVVRHESSYVTETPGVSPSDAIINASAYTLLIVGHSHTYEHRGGKEVLFGNGGAPLSGSLNYGYGVFSQRQDGAIVVDAMDYQTNQADPSFHFVVKPDGSPTQ
jgi:hypothetical protein